MGTAYARREARVSIGSKFSGFDVEEERACSTPEVRRDRTFERLKSLWYKFRNYGGNEYLQDSYFHVVSESLRRMDYTADDVENFSLALAELQDEKGFMYKTGFFLSALINSCEGKSFTIHTHHLRKPPDNLGFLNTKEVTVKGDVGHMVGESMLSGSIRVEGNAGYGLGVLMGPPAESLEPWVDVDLPADYAVPEIHVQGRIGAIDDFERGRIFQNGRLVFERG